MTSILYVGLDVHTQSFTVYCYDMSDDRAFAAVQMNADYREVMKYLNRVNSQRGGNCSFLCGYEAGCLGCSLYHQLTSHGVDCVILAPSTMPSAPSNKIKTDKRDAEKIAKCLARGQLGQKSRLLKARQKDMPPQVVAYADKANERLRRKFRRVALHSNHNIAKTAAARELACFIWGMMNNCYS